MSSAHSIVHLLGGTFFHLVWESALGAVEALFERWSMKQLVLHAEPSCAATVVMEKLHFSLSRISTGILYHFCSTFYICCTLETHSSSMQTMKVIVKVLSWWSILGHRSRRKAASARQRNPRISSPWYRSVNMTSQWTTSVLRSGEKSECGAKRVDCITLTEWQPLAGACPLTGISHFFSWPWPHLSRLWHLADPKFAGLNPGCSGCTSIE